MNKSEELQSEKVKALTDIRDSVNGELSRIDGEINALVSDREKALSDFNIAYAAKTDSVKTEDLAPEGAPDMTKAIVGGMGSLAKETAENRI